MKSIWIKENGGSPGAKRLCLTGDINRKVMIIGAGMTGILTAYFLQQQGMETAILEAGAAGSGQTGRTTAKITSQHGLIYDRLISKTGLKAAREYAEANQRAIDDYETVIEKERISCGFQRLPSWLYTKRNTEALQREKKAAEAAGIPCMLEQDTELPFPVSAALRFDRQAQFHPVEFLTALSEKLEIYENTPVLKVQGKTLITDKGRAGGDVIVFACHFPFINRPGYYFARMHQEKSYILALEKAQRLSGMYYGIDADWNWSFRNADQVLLMGGAGHRTGSIPEEDPYRTLGKKAREFWPQSEITAQWSAQDCMPADDLPFIGLFSRSRPDWYVATGFKKWGMTHAMVSARILSQMILEDPSGYGQGRKKGIFSSDRFRFKASFPAMARDGAISAKNLIASLAGASPKCPHLGCRLHWNLFERTWECQCHGSRFEETGQLLDEPAQTGIKQ